MADADTSRSRLASVLRDVRSHWHDDPDDAVDRLAAAAASDAEWDPLERARLEARLGQLRIFLGRLEIASEGLRSALRTQDDTFLTLQLAAALRWRGGEAAWSESRALAERARAEAQTTRTGPLAIAAHCLLGEIALEQDRPETAVRAFGAALGISEFASSEAITVAPLAGLATAHWRGRAPRKAASLARRALERAVRADDAAGRARALWALAEAEDDTSGFHAAAEIADRAPHRPLALAVRVAACEREGRVPDGLIETAEAYGARVSVTRLRQVRSAFD